jgi:putative component of membrane protein insertase Oxa1/YidC/SpoIIIJ protein YidD
MIDVTVHTCPACSSDEVERVRQHGPLDRMVRALGWRVYRCRDCDRRFYDRPVVRSAS